MAGLIGIIAGTDDGLPVTISELAPPFRLLTLANGDRPEKPVVVASEQRANQSHYPGTQQAVVQFMGTREDTIPLRGWFQDPLTIPFGGPSAQVALARGMQQGGNVCELVWGHSIVRRGRIKRAEFEFNETVRIRYNLFFEVDQPDEAVALTPTPVGVGVVGALTTALDDIVAEAGKVLEAVRTVKTLVGVVR